MLHSLLLPLNIERALIELLSAARKFFLSQLPHKCLQCEESGDWWLCSEKLETFANKITWIFMESGSFAAFALLYLDYINGRIVCEIFKFSNFLSAEMRSVLSLPELFWFLARGGCKMCTTGALSCCAHRKLCFWKLNYQLFAEHQQQEYLFDMKQLLHPIKWYLLSLSLVTEIICCSNKLENLLFLQETGKIDVSTSLVSLVYSMLESPFETDPKHSPSHTAAARHNWRTLNNIVFISYSVCLIPVFIMKVRNQSFAYLT